MLSVARIFKGFFFSFCLSLPIYSIYAQDDIFSQMEKFFSEAMKDFQQFDAPRAERRDSRDLFGGQFARHFWEEKEDRWELVVPTKETQNLVIKIEGGMVSLSGKKVTQNSEEQFNESFPLPRGADSSKVKRERRGDKEVIIAPKKAPGVLHKRELPASPSDITI